MTTLHSVIDANHIFCVFVVTFEDVTVLEQKTTFLIDEADHFIENKFIKLKLDGTLDGLVVLRPH